MEAVERVHKHIATKRIWPKEATNPLAGGDGWQPRQKVHYAKHNAHQNSIESAPASPSKSKATAAPIAAPAPAAAAAAAPVSLPALSSSAAGRAPATAPSAAAPAAGAGGAGAAGANTASASVAKPSTAAAASSSGAAAPAAYRVGIVPGLDGGNERKTGLRVVKPMPAAIKNVVKKMRPQKTSDAADDSKQQRSGKRVLAAARQTISDESTIESVVGHRHRGYTVDEKRNGIGPGGDRGFHTVEYSDRFFEAGASAVAPLKWSPTKQQRADLKRQQFNADGKGSPNTTMSRTGSSQHAQRLLATVSPSKAQRARAAAEEAAVQAILTRKTFKQKLEADAREADIRNVIALPKNLLPAAAIPKDRDNPNGAPDDDSDDDE